MDLIKNKVALITGGVSGIGLSYANELLKNNVKAVALIDIAQNGEEVTNKLIELYGPKVIFIECDVSNGGKLENAFNTVIETYNQLDIVINNAGIIDEINWPRMVNVNMNATIHGTMIAMDKYLPLYRNGEDALIINTSSILGIDADDSIPIYSTIKHAIIGLGKSLGTNFHYNRTKAKILTVCPGITMTSMLKQNPSKVLQHPSRFGRLLDYKKQNPEDVGQSLIHIIKNGRNGSCWVIENGPPPYEIKFPHREQLKI